MPVCERPKDRILCLGIIAAYLLAVVRTRSAKKMWGWGSSFVKLSNSRRSLVIH